MPYSSPHPPYFGPNFGSPNPTGNNGAGGGGAGAITCSYTTEKTVCSEEQTSCGGSFSIDEVGTPSDTNNLNYGAGSISSNGNITVTSSAYCAGYPAFMVVTATCSDGSTIMLDSFVSSGFDENGNCTASEYSRSFFNVCCPAPEEKCSVEEETVEWSIDMEAFTPSILVALRNQQAQTGARVANEILKDGISEAAKVMFDQVGKRMGFSQGTDTHTIIKSIIEKGTFSKSGGQWGFDFPSEALDGNRNSITKWIGDSLKKVLKAGKEGWQKNGGSSRGIILPGLWNFFIVPLDSDAGQEMINPHRGDIPWNKVQCAMNSNPGSGPTCGTAVGAGAPTFSASIASISALPAITSSVGGSEVQNNLLLHVNNGFPVKQGSVTFKVPKTS